MWHMTGNRVGVIQLDNLCYLNKKLVGRLYKKNLAVCITVNPAMGSISLKGNKVAATVVCAIRFDIRL